VLLDPSANANRRTGRQLDGAPQCSLQEEAKAHDLEATLARLRELATPAA